MMDAGINAAVSTRRAGTRPGASRAMALLEQISAAHNIDIRSLRAKANFRHFNLARRDYCVRGLEAGIGTAALADVLRRDRSTVVYHQRPDMQIRKRAQRLRACRKKKGGDQSAGQV